MNTLQSPSEFHNNLLYNQSLKLRKPTDEKDHLQISVYFTAYRSNISLMGRLKSHAANLAQVKIWSKFKFQK